ncbi:unnamed protein product [Penicillium glandicola]
MSKGRRRNRHAKQAKEPQRPACSSLPSPVTEPVRRQGGQQKTKKRLPPSKVFKKHGLNSESPQAGSSDPPLTDHKRNKPGSFDRSRVKVQEPVSPGEPSPTPVQRPPPPGWKILYELESEFEFEYKDKAQAKFQSQLISDHEETHKAREESSSDAEPESERGHQPVSPSQSPPSSSQRAMGPKNTTPVSDQDSQHNPRSAPSSNSMPESQSASISQSEQELSLPLPVSLERVVDHREITRASYPDYGQKARESSTSDTDTESETASEAELPSSSPSPCKITALKRNRSNAYHDSRRKTIPSPLHPSPSHLPEVESEPILPLERPWFLLSSFLGSTDLEPRRRDFRSKHWRKACEERPLPSPSSSRLSYMIGPETPSKSVAETEFQSRESEFESRSMSPIPTTTTISPPSSPPEAPNISQVRSRVLLSPSPPPQRWLPRFERPGQKSSLRPTEWTSRLRVRCYIKAPKIPLMIDGKRFPRLFAELPPAGHENIEYMFPDNSDDDPDFEPPEAKRPRLISSELEGLTDREELSERGESPQPELGSSNPEHELDLEPLLDLAILTNPEPLPGVERSSDPEGELSRTPSMRDESPVRQSRQLNKRIEEEIARDKKENPTHWGGLWMKEYERGGQIKERVEAQYKQEMMRKKEEAERKKKERDKMQKEKKEREKKEMEERKMQKEREEREARKKKEEQERQKQKQSQKKEELERQRAKVREKEREKLKNSISELQKMLDGETQNRRTQGRSNIQGNQSKAQLERLKKDILHGVKLL